MNTGAVEDYKKSKEQRDPLKAPAQFLNCRGAQTKSSALAIITRGVNVELGTFTKKSTQALKGEKLYSLYFPWIGFHNK